MTETVFKAPKPKKMSSSDDEIVATTSKRPRTAEDFYLFCTFILEYEKYGSVKDEDIHEEAVSPACSTGSVAESLQSESSSSIDHSDSKPPITESDEPTTNSAVTSCQRYEDSYDLVTCYCSKPFAGRAMIECSKCLTWVHLSCAKIKKTNIPEVFICIKCKSQKCNSIPPNTSLRPKKRVSV